MEWLTNPEIWVALVTLTALEIVLGIDNIIFISITASRLPVEKQGKARVLGLGAAMGTRILLLLSLFWVLKLVHPLFTLAGVAVSGRDLILLAGGLFLLGKSTHEIHAHFDESGDANGEDRPRSSMAAAIVQIMILDIVFSLDSVITAIGMTQNIGVMIAAVIIAVLVMMVFAGPISRFVDAHPTIRILALSFLILIGVALIAEGMHQHLPKGYIYFAMAFSLCVEMINLRLRARAERRARTARR